MVGIAGLGSKRMRNLWSPVELIWTAVVVVVKSTGAWRSWRLFCQTSCPNRISKYKTSPPPLTPLPGRVFQCWPRTGCIGHLLYSSVLQAAQKMSKNVENIKDGGVLSPDLEPAKSKSFKTFLYDSSTGAVLGRTRGSWCKNFKNFQLRVSDLLC